MLNNQLKFQDVTFTGNLDIAHYILGGARTPTHLQISIKSSSPTKTSMVLRYQSRVVFFFTITILVTIMGVERASLQGMIRTWKQTFPAGKTHLPQFIKKFRRGRDIKCVKPPRNARKSLKSILITQM